MNIKFRNTTDKVFTMVATLAAIMLVMVLIVILGPMLVKGSQAVWFDGTVEFRKMQLALFNRGDIDKLKEQTETTSQYRRKLYNIFDDYKHALEGANTDKLNEKIKQAYREYGDQLSAADIDSQTYIEMRSQARDIRNAIEDAMDAYSNQAAMEELETVLTDSNIEKFEHTAVEKMFTVAKDFKKAIQTIDLSKRDTYQQQLDAIEDGLIALLGPRPDEPAPALAENQFGATRMDMAQRALDKIFYYDKWQPVPGEKSIKVIMERKEFFTGTKMVEFFEYLQGNYKNMLLPENTFYWQYFIDDSTPGHYFGGVGPEILGTIVITIVAMLFAIPLGIISAAWLVECSSDNFLFRIIRMGINTLAGVPSIVFGLFGLAFFVLFLLPAFGFKSEPCILAASLTLAVLTLPVMIRASEEAIKGVPIAYKQASLGLGAGKFKTFVLVTLPAALPGILTGMILSLSRVAGETAPILFTGAVALGSVPNLLDPQTNTPTLEWLFQPTRTLSYGAYDMAVGDRIAMSVPHNQFGMVATLIILILFLNGISIVLRSKVSRKLKAQ